MTCFLYRHFDKDKNLLYVGISLSIFRRLNQHRKSSPWFDKIRHVTIEKFSSSGEAVFAEKYAIQNEHPVHNQVHVHHDDENEEIVKKSRQQKKDRILAKKLEREEDRKESLRVQFDLDSLPSWESLGWERFPDNKYVHKVTGEVIYHKEYQHSSKIEMR